MVKLPVCFGFLFAFSAFLLSCGSEPTLVPAMPTPTATNLPIPSPTAIPTPSTTAAPTPSPILTSVPTIRPTETSAPEPAAQPIAQLATGPTTQPMDASSPKPTGVSGTQPVTPVAVVEGAEGCEKSLERGYNLDEAFSNEEIMECWRALLGPMETSPPDPTGASASQPAPQVVVVEEAEGCEKSLERGYNLDEAFSNEEIMECWRALLGPMETSPPDPTGASASQPAPQVVVVEEAEGCEKSLERGYNLDEAFSNEEIMECWRALLGQ